MLFGVAVDQLPGVLYLGTRQVARTGLVGTRLGIGDNCFAYLFSF